MIGERLFDFVRPHRIDSRVLLTFLFVAMVAFATMMLTSEVAEGDTFAIDKAILFGLRHTDDLALPLGPRWLVTAMTDLTALGSASVLASITLFAVGYLLAVRKFYNAAFVAASISGGAILSGVIKSALVRPRPEIVPHLVEVFSTSFPSGHSMNSAIVYLTLSVLLSRSEHNRRVQVYLIGIAIILTLLVGCTRVYLGVHWPSDVLAGWSVGALWAALCSLSAREFERFGKINNAKVNR